MSEVVKPRVLIVCTDLIFSTKITGTAKALGVPFQVTRNLERLAAALDEAEAGAILIVDLNAAGVDPMAAIRMARTHAAPPRVVAFLSHVQVELAKGAREAGADEVMARSAFVGRLPALISS